MIKRTAMAGALAIGTMVALGAPQAEAMPTLLFTGSISETAGTAVATQDWDNASLTYNVYYQDMGFGKAINWTYEYVFKDPGTIKDVSHMIVETSTNFKSANILDGTTFKGVNTCGGSGTQPCLVGPVTQKANSGNPDMPSDVYGLKFDDDNGSTSGGVRTTTYTIVTDRSPVYGDVYLKSGKSSGDDVTFYNAGFGNPDNDPTGVPTQNDWTIILSAATLDKRAAFDALFTGDLAQHVIVPDSVVVSQIPVPAALPIIGAALAGFGFAGWRKQRKAA